MITYALRLTRALVVGVAARAWRFVTDPCPCEFCRAHREFTAAGGAVVPPRTDGPADYVVYDEARQRLGAGTLRPYPATLDEVRRRRGL